MSVWNKVKVVIQNDNRLPNIYGNLPPLDTPVQIIHNGVQRVGELRMEYPSWDDHWEAYQYWDDPYSDGQDWGMDEVTYWRVLFEYPIEQYEFHPLEVVKDRSHYLDASPFYFSVLEELWDAPFMQYYDALYSISRFMIGIFDQDLYIIIPKIEPILIGSFVGNVPHGYRKLKDTTTSYSVINQYFHFT